MRAATFALLLVLTGCASNRPQTAATLAPEVAVTGSYDEVWQNLLNATSRLGFVPQRTDKESGVFVAEHISAPGELREQWLDCGRRDASLGGPNFARVWNLTPTLSAFVNRGEGNAHTVRLDVSGTAYEEMMGTRVEQPCVSQRALEREIAARLVE